jgi:probable HAF family extracellular repeat protein
VASGEARTCACLAAFTGDTCELPRFEGLGSLPSFQESYAQAISSDGHVIVGYVPQGRTDEQEAFRWTKASGMVGLGYLPSASYGSAAWATNADGKVVVGNAVHQNCQGCGGTRRASRWQARLSIEDLPFVAGHYNGYANGVSADGSVVVGFSYGSPSSETRWMRWTKQAGPEDLGDGYATGVSADGRTIVGIAYDQRPQAMRWTEHEGRIMLGGVEPYWDSAAAAVNADGSIVVGWSVGPSGSRAFRWQKGTGALSLGTLPGDNYSVASATSADGAVVVGDSAPSTAPPSPTRAVLWDETDGMRAIETLLEEAAVDLAGWQLVHASGVSMNGKVVTGWGTNPSGAVESWIARLP